jgi:hypothetical protein
VARSHAIGCDVSGSRTSDPAIIAKSGPLALLGYAYSAHQGQMNRGLVNGLFSAKINISLAAGLSFAQIKKSAI